ncbi:MAG: DUF1700 domain-containing protein [Eubacterium sp.]|nr:DUF1700 domain-containing protein [Eubacterium sp.]
MNKQEYMKQLKHCLRRLPKEDFERAVEYYEEYFAEAGMENEAKAIEDLGSPKEAADQIVRDMALDYSKKPVKDVRSGMNAIWVALLALFALPIALPLLFTGIILAGCVLIVVWSLLLSLLLMAACGVIAGPVTIVAGFTVLFKSVPVFLCCVGMGLLAMGIGAALMYASCLLCRRLMGWTLRWIAGMVQGRKAGHKNA